MSFFRDLSWEEKREVILARDNHQCQTCLGTEWLEIHHRTYERYGKEIQKDLVTLCNPCHYTITQSVRERRQQQQKYYPYKRRPTSTNKIKMRVLTNKQRIIDLLEDTKGSMSPREISNELPKIKMDSLWQTLHSLARQGRIDRIGPNGGHGKYAYVGYLEDQRKQNFG